jgi:hypothetical protein
MEILAGMLQGRLEVEWNQRSSSVPLEELNFTFMLLCGLTRFEGSEVASLAGLRILLAGIQAILS